MSALCTVPILTALQHVSSPYAAFALVMLAMVIVSFYTSISGILKAEMFPAQVRALGVGLSCGRQCPVWWFGGVRCAVPEIMGKRNDILLVCDDHGGAGLYRIPDAASQRERYSSLIMCHLPHGIAGRGTGNIPQNLSSSSRSLRGGYPIIL